MKLDSEPFVRIVNDPFENARDEPARDVERARDFTNASASGSARASHTVPGSNSSVAVKPMSVRDRLSALKQLRGKFFLCLGATATSDIDQISAAGITPEARRLTPALDAEALMLGRTLSADSIPVSPIGIVSPIVISRACLKLMQLEKEVVDCGTFLKPRCEFRSITGAVPARSVDTGRALDAALVQRLFDSGFETGVQAAIDFEYVVIAECVPGGTTTALGVLTALGYNVERMLSSSLPQSQHDVRFALVREGLHMSNATTNDFRSDPLSAIAAVGDPMQAFVLGIVQGCFRKVPVILAGGSQMLAVSALFKHYASGRHEKTSGCVDQSADHKSQNELPIVITTKWVAFDPTADTGAISKMLNVPYAAANPDFNRSSHRGLRAYEEGNVKEGTGAGACMALAHELCGFSEQQILEAIDETYRELVR